MKINPTVVRWTAPTERVDGSAIPGPLDYDIGVEADGSVTELAVIVGTLQTDGVYEAPLADFSFEDGEHSIALRATERDTGLTSAWSTTVQFAIVSAEPRPPLAVAVE